MTAQHPQRRVPDPDVHHEASDVNIRAILAFLGVLFAVAVVVHIVIWALFVFLARQEATSDVRQFPMAIGQQKVPPEPRLQTNPRGDLRSLRDSEEQILGTYGWVDRNAGVVRIPIDKAMKLTLERGLASRPSERIAAPAPGVAEQPGAATNAGDRRK